MLTYKKLISSFRGLYVPKKLVSLFAFYNKVATQHSFPNGFEFHIDEKRNLLKKYSENNFFLNSIYEFASVDESGSIYGFWLIDKTCTLDDAPIVIFDGDYKRAYVISNSLDDFLKIISHETGPSIHYGEVFLHEYDPQDPDEELLEKHEVRMRDQYLNWLKKEYAIYPESSDLERILNEANLKYGVKFSDWLKSFNIAPEEEHELNEESYKYTTRSPPTKQNAAEQLKVIKNTEMTKDREIKEFLEKNPAQEKLGKFGEPQDKFRHGYYGNSSMEYDIWRKGPKK